MKAVRVQSMTWADLNTKLRTIDEENATLLMVVAKKNGWPTSHLMRIQQKLNRLRSSKEMQKLIAAN